jgi:uncharacterized RDD family membrane protein YckC
MAYSSETSSHPASAHDAGNSRYFENVRTRRVLAFLLDYLIVAALSCLAAVAVFFVGIITLGLGWLLYFIMVPLIAMAYVGFTMGGPAQATPGMQFFSIRIERIDGGMVDPALAVLHGVLFWVGHVVLTPFLLAVSLFSNEKRLAHDLLLGTVVVRSDA